MLVLAAMIVSMPDAAAADEPQAEASEPAATTPPAEEPSLSAEPSPDMSAESTEINSANRASGEVIVKLKSPTAGSAIMSTLEASGGMVLESAASDDLMLTGVPQGQTVQSYIDTLEALPTVEYAQPNYIYTLDRSFNDPGISDQWYLDKIGAFGAWDVTTGSSAVKVAIIDSGLDFSHPEFAGQVCAQTDTLDNDGDANDTIDKHGTHVAGIIAAKADNGTGIAGIAPGVQLIIVDAFRGLNAETFDIIQGIEYSVANGADIINMSFGGKENDRALQTAIDNAVNSGVVCVAAAGNDNTAAARYPSDYDSVISVIATKPDDTKASYSNFGSAKDISAPGDRILSTVPGSSYELMSGTSMATPMVSGVIALMLSANPGLSVEQVKSRLYSNADDLGAPGKDDTFGYGRVNAAKAVAAMTVNPVGISCTKTDVMLYGGADGSVNIAASGGNSGSYLYSINGGASWQDSGSFGGLAAGAYPATVCDAAYTGNSASCTVSIGQPDFHGAVAAKKMSSKANAGTAVTIIPPGAPRGYTATSVTFTSTNPSVVSVDANGNVTFRAGGKATVITKLTSQMTDKRGKIRTKITTVKKIVTVKQLVTSISLNLGDATITRTQRLKLIPAFSPVTASYKKVKWTTSNKKVATVSSSGVVTGRAGGTAVITCTARDGSGIAASCIVTVLPIYPTGIKMSKAALTVKLGKTASLKATVMPKNTDFKAVTWTSSNPSVAAVDAKGKVKAVASGTTVITAATSNGQTASCTVTVP